MPLYEYRCVECGNDYEKIVSFSDANLKQSYPTCGSNQTHKKISTATVIGGSSRNSNNTTASGNSCGSGGGFT